MKIVVYGLTITSSWGNGHATTYRALLKALARRGHRIHFVEKDEEWYSSNRDLPQPAYCTVQFYTDWSSEEPELLRPSLDADVVLIGSYFPDGIRAAHSLLARVHCPVLFYDIDTPITLGQLRTKGCTDYLHASLIPSFAAYLSFTGGPALEEIEVQFGAQRAIAFYCSVDPDAYCPTPVREDFRCDLSYLGTYAHDRQEKLMLLLDGPAARLPEQQFFVAGPQYPQEIAWQPNVTPARPFVARRAPCVLLFEPLYAEPDASRHDRDGLQSIRAFVLRPLPAVPRSCLTCGPASTIS